ncbi:hypothetical protein PR202_gb07791 [Eleusine coracana subsp. coracana]|uniref:Uncharacterized protein n=1 Tax=Eleusine coracana subsp. coracana TaxID=191504 RepID=A0AAV5ED44_ELECO|nr:hypothetical protein PR202_gb07791 [Eleusine coracana subsp. coracana]
MFTAGTETSYLVLEFAMAELMLHQETMVKLQADVRRNTPRGQETVAEENLTGMMYLKAVIKETLRLHPPSPLLVPHLSLEDCVVDSYGYTIPAGATVFINAWAISRDPMVWEAAEEFMPERFIQKGAVMVPDFTGKDFNFLPFGSGRRICPGINFAMASIEIVLANLVYHFDWELPEGISNILRCLG